MYAAVELNITITNEREAFETVDAHCAFALHHPLVDPSRRKSDA
jgi:hypothetical protein